MTAGRTIAGSLQKLALHHLGMREHVYHAPSIPPGKEAAARAVHAAHLPEGEAILVLYDATALGGAKEGFVVTAERIAWKNLLEHPRQVPWAEVDPADIHIDDDRDVMLSGGRLSLHQGDARPTSRFLIEAAKAAGQGEAHAYRGAAGAVAETPVARLAALARRHLGEADDVYYHPSIPAAKLDNARAVHALGEDEEVAVLFDATVWGGAREGFVLTPARLCWKNVAEEARAVAWDALDPDQVSATGEVVEVMGGKIELGIRHAMAGAVAELLRAAFAWAHGDG